MCPIENSSFDDADEVLRYPGAVFERVATSHGSVWRYRFEPGWRYSRDIPPEAGSVLCPEPHLMFQLSGRLGVSTGAGAEVEVGPGDITSLPADHDAWVIGDEPAVMVDFLGVTADAAELEASSEG